MTSNDQINSLVAKDLTLKLKLEVKFRKDLRSLFSDITEKYEDGYKTHATIIPANLFKNDLRKILVQNYKVISNNFSSQIRMRTKSVDLKEIKNLDHEVSTRIESYITTHAEKQSEYITQTTHDQMINFINKVKQTAIDKQVVMSNSEVAAQAALMFKKDCVSRIKMIATTETQNMAETSKFIEADVVTNKVAAGTYAFHPALRGKKDFSPEQPTMSKTWVAVLDERTRVAHVIADGQTVPITDAFTVEGEKLMTPGDTSLGASLENIINCRCSSVYQYGVNIGALMSSSPDDIYITQAAEELGQLAPPRTPSRETIGNLKPPVTPFVSKPNEKPVFYTPKIFKENEKGEAIAIEVSYGKYNTIFLQNDLLRTDVPSKGGVIFSSESLNLLKILENYRRQNPEFSYIPILYKEKVVGRIPFNRIIIDEKKGLSVNGYLVPNLEPELYKEAIELIKTGRIKGFSPRTYTSGEKAIKKIPLEDFIKQNPGVDVSHLKEDVKEIQYIKQFDFYGVEINPDLEYDTPYRRFTPIDIKKPLPPGITTLETPKFEVPDNIKNGENVTVVQLADGKKYGFVRGYVSVWNDVTTQRTILEKDLFKKYLEEKITSDGSLPMWDGHESTKEIGFWPFKNMKVDDYGLYAEGFIDLENDIGKQVFNQAKRGNRPSFSVGVTHTVENTYSQDVLVYRKNGELREISIVEFPSNIRAVMMPVIGKDATLNRIVGKNVIPIKYYTPPEIPFHIVKQAMYDQKLFDKVIKKVEDTYGIDYGKIEIQDIQFLKTQNELNDYLREAQEKQAYNFYKDMSKINAEQKPIIDFGIEGIRNTPEEVVYYTPKIVAENTEQKPVAIEVFNGKHNTTFLQNDLLRGGVPSKGGVIFPLESFDKKELLAAYIRESPGFEYVPIWYNDKAVGKIPFERIMVDKTKGISIGGYLTPEFAPEAYKEVIALIKEGKIKGFTPLAYNSETWKKIPLEDFVKQNPGVDVSYLKEDVKEIEYISKFDLYGAKLETDPVYDTPYRRFLPIELNKPLPANITTLETPKFEIPENIKDGQNITVVQLGDGKNYGFVRGYVSVWNVPSANRLITTPDVFKEFFKEATEKNKSIPMRDVHKPDKEIGFWPFSNMKVDGYGLYAEGFVDLSTEEGKAAFNQIKAGYRPGFSIGMTADNDSIEIIQDVQAYYKSTLHEISVVYTPSNTKAVMMPVIGRDADIGRSVGANIVMPKFYDPPEISYYIIKQARLDQKRLDQVIKKVEDRYGINYGTIKVEDLQPIQTQKELDEYLRNIQEKQAYNFYKDMSKINAEQKPIVDFGIEGIRNTPDEEVFYIPKEIYKRNDNGNPIIISTGNGYNEDLAYLESDILLKAFPNYNTGEWFTGDVFKNDINDLFSTLIADNSFRYIELKYKGKAVGYTSLLQQYIIDKKTLRGKFFIYTDTDKGKEVLNKLKSGELRGIAPITEKVHDKYIRETPIPEHLVNLVDKSVSTLKITDKIDIIGFELSESPIYLNKESFVPIDLSKPLPADITTLETPKFVVPDNIKNGENVTIVELVDGKKYGFVRGYVSVWNVAQSHRTIYKKDMFEKYMKKITSLNGSIPMWDVHDPNKEIGFWPFKNMKIDDYGLYAEGFIDLKKDLGKQVFNQAKRGNRPSFSIGCNPDNNKKNIQDVEIFSSNNGLREISTVSEPANTKVVMMPVRNDEGILKTEGDDKIKFYDVPLPKVPIEDFKAALSTQETFDLFWKKIETEYGINFGEVPKTTNEVWKKVNTQEKLDKVLYAFRERQGYDFYNEFRPGNETSDILKSLNDMTKDIKHYLEQVIISDPINRPLMNIYDEIYKKIEQKLKDNNITDKYILELNVKKLFNFIDYADDDDVQRILELTDKLTSEQEEIDKIIQEGNKIPNKVLTLFFEEKISTVELGHFANSYERFVKNIHMRTEKLTAENKEEFVKYLKDEYEKIDDHIDDIFLGKLDDEFDIDIDDEIDSAKLSLSSESSNSGLENAIGSSNKDIEKLERRAESVKDRLKDIINNSSNKDRIKVINSIIDKIDTAVNTLQYSYLTNLLSEIESYLNRKNFDFVRNHFLEQLILGKVPKRHMKKVFEIIKIIH